MNLEVMPERWANKEQWEGTGIYVRAKLVSDDFESVDISVLKPESLLEWLKSRGGDNPWAEDVVGILLGHGHLHAKKSI